MNDQKLMARSVQYIKSLLENSVFLFFTLVPFCFYIKVRLFPLMQCKLLFKGFVRKGNVFLIHPLKKWQIYQTRPAVSFLKPI